MITSKVSVRQDWFVGSKERSSTLLDLVAAIDGLKIRPHSHCFFSYKMKRHASKL